MRLQRVADLGQDRAVDVEFEGKSVGAAGRLPCTVVPVAADHPTDVPAGHLDVPPQAPTLAGAELLDVAVSDGDSRGVVLTVRGEVDMHSSGMLRGAVDSVLAGRPRMVVLDLQGVTFFASAGLSILVDLRRAAGLRRIAMRVVCDVRAVLRPIEAVGLAGQFARSPTVEDALSGPAEQ